MNKKKEEPKFLYPFKNTEEEESYKRFVSVKNNYLSDKNTNIKLVETNYRGGYKKLTLTETVYLQVTDKVNKLSDTLYLRPYDQVHTNKYLIFDVHINSTGNMYISRRGLIGKTIEFNNGQSDFIMYFYEHRDIELNKAPLFSKYRNKESARATIIKINRIFISQFKLSKKDKVIYGSYKKGYTFNDKIKLNVINDNELL